MVTASNKSGTITRNSSYFKKAPTESDNPETSDDEDSDVPVGQPEAAVIRGGSRIFHTLVKNFFLHIKGGGEF